MKLRTFTIIEKKWARGGINGDRQLRNNQGNKCCLGFLANAAGLSRLGDAGMPNHLCSTYYMQKPYMVSTVVSKLRGLVRDVKVGVGTAIAAKLALINDDERISDAERKKKLDPLFRKIGWRAIYR